MERFSHALNNKRQMELDQSTNRKSQIDRNRDRLRRFAKGLPALAATIVIAMFLTTSAIAQEGSMPTASTLIGSMELLKTAMHFQAPWVPEIISSRAATNVLSTGANPSRCVGFWTPFLRHLSAIRIATTVTVRMHTVSAAVPSVRK
jgi:hypothetical protein